MKFGSPGRPAPQRVNWRRAAPDGRSWAVIVIVIVIVILILIVIVISMLIVIGVEE